MVHLSQTSKVNLQTQPLAHQWDTVVRKHFNKYQSLIDAQTYQMQRTQRLILSFSYPRFYNSDLLVLNLLRKKQSIGEVTQEEVDLYKNINSSVASDYNRTFNHNLPIPFYGVGVGAGFFSFATLFNFTMPTRIVLFAAPVIVDFIRLSSDCLVESKTSQFMDWVIGYRKARCWSEKHKSKFNTAQTRKIIGENSLADLGRQIFALASGQK